MRESRITPPSAYCAEGKRERRKGRVLHKWVVEGVRGCPRPVNLGHILWKKEVTCSRCSNLSGAVTSLSQYLTGCVGVSLVNRPLPLEFGAFA